MKCQDNNPLCCFTNLVISLVWPQFLSSGFTSDFQFYDYYIIAAYILLSPCVLFHQSPALILSYHEYSLLDITCFVSTCSCVLVPRHGFQCMFMIRIYRYTCSYLCSPLDIRITTRRGVLIPLDPHV